MLDTLHQSRVTYLERVAEAVVGERGRLRLELFSMSATRPPRPSRLKLQTRLPASAVSSRSSTGTQQLVSACTLEVTADSDANIPDAVRRAMTEASRVLTTLDGANIRVLPQQFPNGHHPRFSVTLTVVKPGK